MLIETLEALEKYDDGKPAREAKRMAIKNAGDTAFYEWLREDLQASYSVKEAFVRDLGCKYDKEMCFFPLSVEDIRRAVQRWLPNQ